MSELRAGSWMFCDNSKVVIETENLITPGLFVSRIVWLTSSQLRAGNSPDVGMMMSSGQQLGKVATDLKFKYIRIHRRAMKKTHFTFDGLIMDTLHANERVVLWPIRGQVSLDMLLWRVSGDDYLSNNVVTLHPVRRATRHVPTKILEIWSKVPT